MRVVVCAYSEVGHACLAELIEMGAAIALVVTHRDAPGEKRWFSSVADLARSAGLDVITPDDINAPKSIERIRAARPDLLLSAYFRQMMKRSVLEIPVRDALNMHGSLLPSYRGRAPVNWVLVRGETETGVTLHHMDEKPDHGDIVDRQSVPIERDDSALTLTRKLAAASRTVLRRSLPLLEAGTAPRIAQDHARASYFGGRRPADGEIDWRASAEQIRNLVRAVTDPWPGAYAELRGERLFVWWCESGEQEKGRVPGEIWIDAQGAPWVATGDGAVSLTRVGRADSEPLNGIEWARTESIRTGERFAVNGI